MTNKDLEGNISVFTYGTLMTGFPNEHVIRGFPHKNYVAEIRGMELYDVGHFPAMVKGDHTFNGELVVFDSSVDVDGLYRSMDRLEGYDPKNKKGSLYVREKATVYVDGNPIDTEVYLWNRSLDGLYYIDPGKYSGYREFVNTRRILSGW